MMTLTVPQMRAIPLLILGAGVFALAATYEMPDMAGPPIDVAGLHATASPSGSDPSGCADGIAPDCAIEVPVRGVLLAGP